MTTPLRLDGLLAKIESQYGTDPTPTVADDGVRISQRLWSNLRKERAFPNQRPTTASGSLLDVVPATPQGRMAAITVALELRGAGSAYSATVLPEADPLLRACGMARTDDFTGGAELVSYSPADTSHESCTVWGYAAGKLYKINGCRGTFRLELPPGQLAQLVFELLGILAADETEVALPQITYDAQVPPAVVGTGLQLGGSWNPKYSTAAVVLGAQVQRQDSGNASSGIDRFAISGFQPRFQVTAETDALSNFNPASLVTNRTTQSVAATIGSTQYNRLDIAVTDAYLLNDPEPAEFNEFTAWGMEFQLQDLVLRFN